MTDQASANDPRAIPTVEVCLRTLETWNEGDTCPFCLGNAQSHDGHGDVWENGEEGKGLAPCPVFNLRRALAASATDAVPREEYQRVLAQRDQLAQGVINEAKANAPPRIYEAMGDMTPEKKRLEDIVNRAAAGVLEEAGALPAAPAWPNMPAWSCDNHDDTPLPEDAQIGVAFPTRSGKHAQYAEAMRLVGARRSKGGLVALVSWLLVRLEEANANETEALREVEKAALAYVPYPAKSFDDRTLPTRQALLFALANVIRVRNAAKSV